MHHVPGPGKWEDKGRRDPEPDDQPEQDRGPAPGLCLSRQDAPAALTGRQRKPEHGQDRVLLRRAHEGKRKHDAPKDRVHRQVFAQGEEQGKPTQPGKYDDQGASAAKAGQSQGQHAGTHIHAIRKRQAVGARLAHPVGGRVFAIGIAHGAGGGELDQAQRVQRIHFCCRTRKRHRPGVGGHERARGNQRGGPGPAGEQQGERDRADKATRKAGQGRDRAPFQHLRGRQQRQGETDPHDGQERLAHQKG